MEAGWLIHEVAQRTRNCHFPPLVATCTNGDNGGWFRNTSPQANFWHVFYRNLLQRVQDNQSEGIRPCFIDDYLARYGACGEVKVRPGLEPATPVDQLVDPQRTLTRLDEISQAIYAARRNAVGISAQDPMCTSCSSKPTGGSCGPRPVATLFWGDAWRQRCHDDLDRATDFLDQAVARIT